MNNLANGIKEVMTLTWPMILLTCIVLIIFRITYIIKNKVKINLYHELLMLLFIIYILSMFQIVTSQDVSGEHGINVTLFRELTRYKLGSRLFYRNIIGNIVLFAPFGYFSTAYLKLNKKREILLLTFIISLVIEFIQLNIGRAFDVDDIILNLVGGLIGYFIYHIMEKIFGKLSEKIKGLLTLILVLIGILLIAIMIL